MCRMTCIIESNGAFIGFGLVFSPVVFWFIHSICLVWWILVIFGLLFLVYPLNLFGLVDFGDFWFVSTIVQLARLLPRGFQREKIIWWCTC